jgi:hypothetical protein
MQDFMAEFTSYRPELRGHVWSASLMWVMRRAFSGGPPPTTRPLSEPFWSALLEVVQRDRIAGHLLAAIDAGLAVTPVQMGQARLAYRLALTTDTVIEHVLVGLAELLEVEDIRWRVIKGVAAARMLYPDPLLRSTGDVDVLVHPNDFARAVESIRAKGGTSWEYVTHGPAAGLAAPARTLMHSTNTELDVHREVRGHAGRYRLPTETLFASSTTIDVMGRELPAPPLQVVILHAMLHLSKGGPSFGRLSTLGDLLWARETRPEAYEEACALADRLGFATPAAWADRVTEEWLPDPARTDPLRLGRGSTSELRLWAFDRAVGSGFVSGHLHRFVGRHRLRRAWEAALPTREFRERHQRSAFAQLRHIAKRLLTG